MGSVKNFRAFISAFLRHRLALMSGVVSLALAVWQQRQGHDVLGGVFVIISIGWIMAAFYLSWRGEHLAWLAARQRLDEARRATEIAQQGIVYPREFDTEILSGTVREYEGEGFIILTSGKSYECRFKAAQKLDGSILFQAGLHDQNQALPLQLEVLSKQDAVRRIEGRSQNGLSVVADHGLWLLGSTESGEILVRASRLFLDSRGARESVSTVLFGFVNLDFWGNEWATDQGTSSLSRLRLELSGNKVVFDRVPHYEQILETVRAEHSVGLTAILRCYLSKTLYWEQAVEIADDLSLLLSFARARFVNYIYYEALDTAGNPVLIEHRHRIIRTWPERSLPAIDYRDPKDTLVFVQSGYPALQELKRELNHAPDNPVVTKIVHAILDAQTAGFYLTGALTAVSLFDFLRGHWGLGHRSLEIVRRKTFKKHRSRIYETLQRALVEEFPELSEEKIALMASHVDAFPWWPMRDSYKHFFSSEWISVPLTDRELDRFISIRNELVHRMHFPSVTREGNWADYLVLMDLLNKVVLSLFNYDGHYLNWTNKERERFQRTCPGA